ncbi:ParB-like nuclease family protein [Roseimicrobium gellanilyticum]|uniref:ParB-like nuclease family protein n=1 Tax=Roseimicrobium gellanilyticum TaxID=748857 RepID=A0A366H8Z4_9BACT|nr:helix-turn-helix domain-containing protein [Roseimicrobium gellanilyticum]RBP38584.1 ParB-like nuclease family protein [Roseimicrobium gellanilyticum]
MEDKTAAEALMTPKEAALHLKCQRPNIYPLIKSGKLVGVKKERITMVTKESVSALAKARGHNAPEIQSQDLKTSKHVAGETGDPAAIKKADVVDTPSINPREPANTGESTLQITTMERRVPIRTIVFDESVQVRVNLDEATVLEYSERMRAGEMFPPVQLFDDKGKLFIGDGWHRLKAAKTLNYVHFPAVVSTGGRLAAIKFALSANASHGLPRSQADKHKAIVVAALEFPNISNRELARLCAVSEGFVRTHRTSCVTNAPDTRLGADGKRYASRKPSGQQKKAGLLDPRVRQKANEAQAKKVCALLERLDLPSLLAIRGTLESKIALFAAEKNSAAATPTTPSKKVA